MPGFTYLLLTDDFSPNLFVASTFRKNITPMATKAAPRNKLKIWHGDSNRAIFKNIWIVLKNNQYRLYSWCDDVRNTQRGQIMKKMQQKFTQISKRENFKTAQNKCKSFFIFLTHKKNYGSNLRSLLNKMDN